MGKAFRFFYTFVFFLTLFDGYRYMSSASTLYVSCEKNIHIAETAQNFWIGTVNWHVSLEAEFKNSTLVKFISRSRKEGSLFPRSILTSFEIIGGFTERPAPETWKRGCIVDLTKIINQIAQKLQEIFSSGCSLNMHSLFMKSFMCQNRIL